MTAEKILENKYTEKEIIDEIENIKLQLNKTRMNFEMCTDEILIDSYIYEIISLNKKYQYFFICLSQKTLMQIPPSTDIRIPARSADAADGKGRLPPFHEVS